MPGNGGNKGARGHAGPKGHGGPFGHGGGTTREGQDGEIGQHRDTNPADNDMIRGRSESSPGHLKKVAGDQSARDYAPGRTATADRDPSVADVAPDEIGEDERG